MQKILGKITSVHFGYVGYQESMFGLSLTFENKDGLGVGDTIAYSWATEVKATEFSKWSEKDRDEGFAKTMREINSIMRKAKVTDITKLKNIPVEFIIENNKLKSWRILDEVL